MRNSNYLKFLIAVGLSVGSLSLASLSASSQGRLAAAAQTPPMGWNSYDSYGATVTVAEVKANANYQAKYLKQFGWDYVVVDFCWYYPEPAGSKVSPPQQKRPRRVTHQRWRWTLMGDCSRLSESFRAPREGRDLSHWPIMCIRSD